MSFVSEDVANVSCSADCRMQAAYDRELGELHRLPVVIAVGKECIQNFFWGERLVGTLGKYVVMKLSKEVECFVICVGGK